MLRFVLNTNVDNAPSYFEVCFNSILLLVKNKLNNVISSSDGKLGI